MFNKRDTTETMINHVKSKLKSDELSGTVDQMLSSIVDNQQIIIDLLSTIETPRAKKLLRRKLDAFAKIANMFRDGLITDKNDIVENVMHLRAIDDWLKSHPFYVDNAWKHRCAFLESKEIQSLFKDDDNIVGTIKGLGNFKYIIDSICNGTIFDDTTIDDVTDNKWDVFIRYDNINGSQYFKDAVRSLINNYDKSFYYKRDEYFKKCYVQYIESLCQLSWELNAALREFYLKSTILDSVVVDMICDKFECITTMMKGIVSFNSNDPDYNKSIDELKFNIETHYIQDVKAEWHDFTINDIDEKISQLIEDLKDNTMDISDLECESAFHDKIDTMTRFMLGFPHEEYIRHLEILTINRTRCPNKPNVYNSYTDLSLIKLKQDFDEMMKIVSKVDLRYNNYLDNIIKRLIEVEGYRYDRSLSLMITDYKEFCINLRNRYESGDRVILNYDVFFNLVKIKQFLETT